MSALPARVPAGTRALTVKQPWASLIIEGHKDVENRSWRTNHRGLLIIHAGMKVDRAGLDHYRHLLRYPDDLDHGCLLGTVELEDCVDGSKSRWALRGQFHWLLVDPRPFRSPIPIRGALGLWRP